MTFYTLNQHVIDFDSWQKVYEESESTRNQFIGENRR